MSDTVGRIRTTSDRLLEDLETLRRLEEEKRSVSVGSARFRELAAKVEELGRGILARTERQRDLGEQANEEGAASASSTIDGTPRQIGLILSEWRDAERRQGDAEPGSADAAQARHDVERLREEYRFAADRARGTHPTGV